MKAAVFFQKHGYSIIGKILFKLYKPLLKSNRNRINYLRDAGAIIGKNCYIPSIDVVGSEPYLITIKDNVYITGNARFATHDGAVMQLRNMGFTEKSYDLFGRIEIGNNCFIGMNSTILKNVTLGDNCIVGAGAVVTKSFPTGSVIAGIPAKRIGSVEDFYNKNKADFIDTFGINPYRKRGILEERMRQGLL